MVRPRFGPPRFKPRPFADGHGNMSSEVHYAPHSKGRRNDQDYAASGAPGWRESRGGGRGGGGGGSRGGGRPPFSKRPPLMGERREPPPFNNHWKNQNQGSFQAHPSQMDPRRGRPSPSGHGRPSPSSQRRPSPSSHSGPSPSRSNRSPHAPPHRSSPHSPAHGSPAGHRRPPPPFHGPPSSSSSSSSHRPSPRHYQGHPADRPPSRSASPPHGSFRTPKRPPPPPAFPQKEQRGGRGDPPPPRGHQSPRERPYEHHSPHNKPWNVAGAFSHQHNGEHGGPSGSQRKPRELHGRGSYPERWPAVQDARKQHGGRGGGVAREGRGGGRGRPHSSADRAPESHSNPPPYRPPPWKGGPPSSSYHQHHHAGPHGEAPPPRKRRMPDADNMPFPRPPPLLEHRPPPKHPRRGEAPSLFSIPRPAFGGRPLSLRDKSRIMKGRQLRAESILRLRAPPMAPFRPRPPLGGSAAAGPKGTPSSLLALRKKRFQTNAPAAKTEPRRPTPPRRSSSSPNPDTNEEESSRDSDTDATEQVESRRSVSARSSSPIDKHLSSDLVVVSHWQAGPSSSSSQGRSSPKERNKFKTERNPNPDAPYGDHRGRYVDMKSSRPMNALHEIHRPGRPFKRPGPGHNPRMKFNPSGPRRPAPVPLGNFRKPLMESFVPRPFPQQTKPVFRKSQSIMSKYRTIQQARQRGPYNRGPNQRW